MLDCPAINQLDILNLAENFLSEDTIERIQQLDCQVIADNQKEEYDEEDYGYSRYCSVAELPNNATFSLQKYIKNVGATASPRQPLL